MARNSSDSGSKPAKTAGKAEAPTRPKAKAPRTRAVAQASKPTPAPASGSSPPAQTESSRATLGVGDGNVRLDAGQRQAIEALSLNLAKASLTAQGAITEAMLRQGKGAPSADPFHVAPALTEVMGKLVLKPERIMRAQAELFESYMDLWTQSARRSAGEASTPVAAPAKGDKRFNDPDWSAKVGPRGFLDLQGAGEGDVAVEMAFVELVEEDRRDAGQHGVGEHLAQEDALGDVFDARAGAGNVVEADAVADLRAERRVAFARHAGGEHAGRQAAGLEGDNLPIAEQPGIQEHLRHLRRFARAGGRLQDEPGRTRTQEADEVGFQFVDGQAVGGRRGQGRPQL